MNFDWNVRRLGDSCLKIGSGATPRGGKDAYLEHGPFKLIRSQNIYNDGFSASGLVYLDKSQAQKLDGVAVTAGDVLLNITGDSVARVCQAPAEHIPARVNQHVAIIRPDPRFFDSRFIRYFLATPMQQNYMLGLSAAGATRNALTKGMIEDLLVPCPSIEIQSGIADVLGGLDDRIALLRETNATLEAIAQALFKSWFVDFDPVRAKMESRAPEGMDEATAALFPDGLEESELGLVPRGWLASTLAEQTSKHGGTIQTGPFGSQLHASDYSEDGTPVAMPKDITGRRINTSSVARVAAEHVTRLARHQLSEGDIVFSRRGDVERHALVTEREVGWLCGTGCLLVRPGKNWRWPAYLSMLLDSPKVKLWLLQHAVGATMPNLNTGILGSIPVVLPHADILSQFEHIAMALETRRSENLAAIETLTSLRDTLLPRMISGQLRLPETEEILN